MLIVCAYCGKEADLGLSKVGRARRDGYNLYCNRTCSGLGCRLHKTEVQKKEEKRLYDIDYREKNLDRIKARKSEHHKRTYDPLIASIERKKKMLYHLEYCRSPEYREYKKNYDRKYRDRKNYGDFAEAYHILMKLEIEIEKGMSKYEIRQQNDTINKKQKRGKA